MAEARRTAVAATLTLFAMACVASRSFAADDPSAMIRAALEQWRDDFNARRAEHICDLFAHDLRYDFQGVPEQNYMDLCNRLHHALADPTQSYHYDLRIKEILVSGNLAVVRLTWASTLTENDGKQVIEDEPGLDVFGKQSDGEWKIIRYMSYPENPR